MPSWATKVCAALLVNYGLAFVVSILAARAVRPRVKLGKLRAMAGDVQSAVP